MSKKILKIILITLSSVYIAFNLMTEGFLNMLLDTALDPIENIFFILSIILLLIGIIIDDSNDETVNSKKIDNNINTQKIKKYKILRFIGFLPFILVISCGIFFMFTGFGFFFNTSHGVSAFFGSIFFISLFAWPLYIVGIILIIKSNQKLKK